MKKILVFAIVLGGLSVMTSCKKDYTCTVTVGGVDISTDYNELDKDQAESKETDCESVGGTWATK